MPHRSAEDIVPPWDELCPLASILPPGLLIACLGLITSCAKPEESDIDPDAGPVSSSPTVTSPSNPEKPPSDLPTFEGEVTTRARRGDVYILNFKSPISPAEAVGASKAQLKELGWTETASMTMPHGTTLTFEKAPGRSCQIVVNQHHEGLTAINLTLTERKSEERPQ